MGVTERLARASSRHPWRTFGVWLGATVVAVALAVMFLPGNLTTTGHVTGNPESAQAEHIFDHDFNELSQHDLKSGELQVGLPAALVVLVLVFGTVVAGLLPLLLAIVAIVVALGLCAVVAETLTLSVFFVNMLTGMGLALGI